MEKERSRGLLWSTNWRARKFPDKFPSHLMGPLGRKKEARQTKTKTKTYFLLGPAIESFAFAVGQFPQTDTDRPAAASCKRQTEAANSKDPPRSIASASGLWASATHEFAISFVVSLCNIINFRRGQFPLSNPTAANRKQSIQWRLTSSSAMARPLPSAI